MDKIFTYSNSRKDPTLSIFRAQYTEQHADMLKAISSNTATGYVVDTGTNVRIPRHAMGDVSRHLIARGWTLGV